jgi:hypothetical protein
MSRLVKEFIEIRDHATLDGLIASLAELRDNLPASAEPEVKMRGDDIFGRQLTISYFRPQTDEEAACDERYAHAYRMSRERELSKLQDELGVECRVPRRRQAGQLRIVA